MKKIIITLVSLSLGIGIYLGVRDGDFLPLIRMSVIMFGVPLIVAIVITIQGMKEFNEDMFWLVRDMKRNIQDNW